jgi:hypothetical protein
MLYVKHLLRFFCTEKQTHEALHFLFEKLGRHEHHHFVLGMANNHHFHVWFDSERLARVGGYDHLTLIINGRGAIHLSIVAFHIFTTFRTFTIYALS